MFKAWKNYRFHRKLARAKRTCSLEDCYDLTSFFNTDSEFEYHPSQGASLVLFLNYPNLEIYLELVDGFCDTVIDRLYIRKDYGVINHDQISLEDYLSTKTGIPVTLKEAQDNICNEIERLYHAINNTSLTEQTYYQRHAQVLLQEALKLLETLWRFRC